MRIMQCGKADYAALAGIWERSVRATHDFLSQDSIKEIGKALLSDYFPNVDLYVAVDNGSPVGFIGLSGEMIEMLFVDADCRGLGYGSMLLDFAKANGATRVDVNQQNPSALLFYISKGFHIIGLDDTDEAGRPYPILHLSL